MAANHRPAGSNWDPPLDDGFNIDLVKGISDWDYLYPFYFGRSGENVFVMMFDRSKAGDELRFDQSPSGGGKGNPAWDFFYFRRDYAVGREFSFPRGRFTGSSPVPRRSLGFTKRGQARR